MTDTPDKTDKPKFVAPKYPGNIVHSHCTQFAPVCPLPVARELKEHGLLGNYHLLLAHDVVKDPKGYAEVYSDPENFIIMDNSAAELKAPVDYEMLLEAGFAVNADCLVLPDYLLESAKTYSAHMEAIEKLQGRWFNDYMALPQGEDMARWIWCAKELTYMMPKRVRYFGVPRNIREKLNVSRGYALQILNMIDPVVTRKYHLFGFSNDLLDDIMSAHLKYTTVPRLLGIDSAVPVRMGYNGVGLHPLQKDPGPRGDWWEIPGEFNACVRMNLNEIRHWLKGGQS